MRERDARDERKERESVELMTNDFASYLWCGVYCHLVERAESCYELLHFKGNHLAGLLAEHTFLYINCL